MKVLEQMKSSHHGGVTKGSELTQDTTEQSATRSSSTFHPRRLMRIMNTVSYKPEDLQQFRRFQFVFFF